MKQTKIFWGFLLLIITLVTGCSKEDVVNNDTTTPPNTENKITLRASTGSDTRIGFEEEEATGKIKLTWKKADKFALYDATTGALAATFTLTGGDGTANGTFNTENTLTDGASYTVCYPAIADATTLAKWESTMETRQRVGQTVEMSNSNDPMAHLSDIFGMSQKDYTYDANNPASIKFSHHYAMLTLEIAKPANYTDTDAPTALYFVNGSAATKVTLANFPTWNEGDMLKIYTLMLPSAGTERTLSFSLDGKGASYVADVNSSTAYEAGKRYTAKLKDGNALVALTTGLYYRIDNGIKTIWDAETFKTALTSDATVSISTVGGTKMNSTNYKNLLNAIASSSCTGVTLDFSGAMAEGNAMTRGDFDYTAYTGIKAVSDFPVGITSLAGAFRSFTNLTSVAEIPNSVTNMYDTFYKCESLNQPITIPNSVTNMGDTFYGCTSFNQPITIGNSVTDMGGTFINCSNFNQNITIPNSVTNMYGAFSGCTSFNQPITIPNSVTDMSYTFYNCSALASTITIYGADSLTRDSAFGGTTKTANISLILGPNRASEWTGNTWEGYTFKSITIISAE